MALQPSPRIIKTITPQLIQEELQLANPGVQADLAEIMTPPRPYTIGAGDYLSITVWEHPELGMQTTNSMLSAMGVSTAGTPSSVYTVDSEGAIQFPYVGDIKVKGLTAVQARNLLSKRLASYIKKPEVTMSISGFRSKRVYIDGEVNTPGIVSINDIPLTLTEAINRAGGITPLGDQSRITIARSGKNYQINMPYLAVEGINPSRIMLSNGDMLRVPSQQESKVFVIGEVVKPSSLTLRSGKLSLNEALGEAGGFNPQTADAAHVYVIRSASDVQPVIYHLDARSPAMLTLAERFKLKAKDVVYVDATSMVRFNRILSLILPSAQGITIINRGFK